jgi:hypothetical protein
MVMNPVGLKPEKDCSGKAQQQLYIIDASSRQRGRLHDKGETRLPEDKLLGRERKLGCGSQMVA